MHQGSEVTQNNAETVENILSWQFGTAVLAAGIINMFWGNDTLFGIFIAVLSLFYFLPVNAILDKILGFTLPKVGIVKIILGIVIVWAVFGVGELFDKIELMINYFKK